MADQDETAKTAPAENEVSLDEALASSSLLSSGVAPAQPVEEVQADLAHDEDEYDDHDEVGTPLSAKILTGLGVLLAGGVIALWAGPKIAPHLPAGMESTRAWLMPGAGVSADDLATLRQDLEAQIAAKPSTLDEDRVVELITEIPVQDAGSAEAIEALRKRINELSDQAEAFNRADLPKRLEAVESRLEGISGQLESLGTLAESADGLSEDAVAQISKFAAMVDGLRSEIKGLTERNGEIAQRLDEVAANAERRISETETELTNVREKAADDLNQATIRTVVIQLSTAVSKGLPYQEPLDQLAERLDSPLVAELAPMAAGGVATMPELRAGFGDAAHAAIRADIKAGSNESALGRLNAFVGAQVASRSLTPQEGNSTDAILSRAEDKLRQDDLAGTMTELQSLSPEAGKAMAVWSDRAQARLNAVEAVAALTEMTQAAN
ncbi:COG4223 family protein [Halovulum sp. GXIMD14793]